MQRFSFKAVHLLYFLTLCLMAANIFLAWMPQYVRLILNEALFVFLPAYLYLRLTHQPVRERVRWRNPGWKIAVLSLVIGMGLYPVSIASAGVFQSLLGYSNVLAAPDAIPSTVLMGVLAILAYAVMAPLCEEFFFRGVIQPVYETRGPRWTILFVGLLFIGFHLSLLQGLSIILLSLALGFVNYRTRSLVASILTHFGANVLAALVLTEGVFPTGISQWIATPPAILGGLAAAALALISMMRLTRTAEEPQFSPVLIPTLTKRQVFNQNIPLFAALLIYVPFIALEVVFSRSPELLTGVNAPALVLTDPRWQEPLRWQFEIRNITDAVVGEGECRLESTGEETEVTCSSQVRAYETQYNGGTYTSSGGERTDTTTWTRSDGTLRSGSTVMHLTDGSYGFEISWEMVEDHITIHRQATGEDVVSDTIWLRDTPLAQDPSLITAPDHTLPWQIAGLRFSPGETGSIVCFQPYTWRQQTGDMGPLAERCQVAVSGPEEVTTPAGTFRAWKVNCGADLQAWYDVDHHAPIQFFNGVETWLIR